MLSRDDIKKIIPHREPMLLLDGVDTLEPGVKATGFLNVTEDMFWCVGHFPGNPVMPGVLIVEAMAQTAGALVVHSLGGPVSSIVYFMTIEKARFRKPVLPGELLRMDVKLSRRRDPVWKYVGQAFVGDTLVAEAEFSAMITDGRTGGQAGSKGA